MPVRTRAALCRRGGCGFDSNNAQRSQLVLRSIWFYFSSLPIHLLQVSFLCALQLVKIAFVERIHQANHWQA